MVALTLLLGFFFATHQRCERVFQKTYLLPPMRQGFQPPPTEGNVSGGAAAAKPDATQTGQAQAPGTAGQSDVQPDVQSGMAGGDFSSGTAAVNDEGQIFFSEPFAVRSGENIEIRIRVSGANFWLGIDGDLVDEQSGVVQEFSLPIEYYAGVSEGESWSEGSRDASVYLSALPAGKYMLRIAGQQEPQTMPLTFDVSVYENVARTTHFLAALAAVSLIPGFVLLLQGMAAYSRSRQ